MKLFLRLKYDGAPYAGYQVQPGRDTVQGRLNSAALALFGTECDITGCSRTDAGVHALGFCATVTARGTQTLESSVPLENIPSALNRFLPDSISVSDASWKPEDFHPRYDIKRKTYMYRILNTPQRDPFLAGRVWHYPRPVTDAAIVAMRTAAASFTGRHDFTSYMASGSKITDAVRTVYTAGVTRDGDEIHFTVSADGFLYNMVRIMCGTLIEVSEGRISPGGIPALTQARDRQAAGRTAPACGLYLVNVEY